MPTYTLRGIEWLAYCRGVCSALAAATEGMEGPRRYSPGPLRAQARAGDVRVGLPCRRRPAASAERARLLQAQSEPSDVAAAPYARPDVPRGSGLCVRPPAHDIVIHLDPATCYSPNRSGCQPRDAMPSSSFLAVGVVPNDP